MLRRYLQLDVFAERAGMGNPLGVVLDGDGLDTPRMQALAAWLDLSETVFFVPTTHPHADYAVRIFTPVTELPFAGHPSVGAAWAAVESGLVAPDAVALQQQCAAGLLPARLHEDARGRRAAIRAPRAMQCTGDAAFAPLLDAALAGMPRGALAARWNNGPTWWCVELADAAAVRDAAPDLAAIAALTRASGAVGLAVFAPAQAGDHALVVRAFCPADGIDEDPVTGSANACIAAQLADAARLPAARFVSSQGRELGRDGRVEIEVDDECEVWIGGAVQAVVRGTLEWD